MNLLSFDTSLNKTYVSISKDGIIIDSKIIKNTENYYHSAFLISTIKAILKENNLTPKDVNLLAVNVGPGSFTGIRAALTVAKVMAQELDIKIIPISSLKILSKLNFTDKKTLVTMDARRSMAYVFIAEEVKVISIEQLKELIKPDMQVIYDKNLAGILGLESAIIFEEREDDLGKILNELAFENKSSAVEGIELKALYIQPPPVFVKK